MFLGAFPIVYREHRGWSEGIGGISFSGEAVGILLGIGYIFPKNHGPKNCRSTRRNSRVPIAALNSWFYSHSDWHHLLCVVQQSVSALPGVYCSSNTLRIRLRLGIHQRAGISRGCLHVICCQCSRRQYDIQIGIRRGVPTVHKCKELDIPFLLP